MAKTENPVLVKVKNERIAKSLENLDKTSANSKGSPLGSPKTLAKASSSKANKQNDSNEVDLLFFLIISRKVSFYFWDFDTVT